MSFKTSKLEIYQKIYENLRFIDANPIGAQLIKNKSDAAAIGSRAVFVYYSYDKNLNGFYLPPKSEESTFSLSLVSFALRKGFQYKQSFDKMYIKSINNLLNLIFISLLRMKLIINNGISDHLMKKYKLRYDLNNQETNQAQLNLFSLDHFIFYTYILISNLLFASIVFGFEFSKKLRHDKLISN